MYPLVAGGGDKTQAHQAQHSETLLPQNGRELDHQLNADQDAYHARLHADCRPEIGCMPAGWMGW